MSNDAIKPLGTILSIWAHPDDESWCAAGILAAAVANGQRVVCVTATRGEKGVQDESRWPAAKLGKIREKELENALEILGIKKHHWLGYVDGTCHDVPQDEAVGKLVEIMGRVKPDTVLTFGPHGSTGHPDHIAVCRWTTKALDQARPTKPTRLYYVADSKEWYDRHGHELDKAFDVFFNIENPPLIREKYMDLCYRPPKNIMEKKLRALRVQVSQTQRVFASPHRAGLEAMAACEGFVLAEHYDKALRASRAT